MAAGGSGRLLLSPKFSAYFAFAASTSSRILVIAFGSCSELSQGVGYQEKILVQSHLPLRRIVNRCGAATRALWFGPTHPRSHVEMSPQQPPERRWERYQAPSRDRQPDRLDTEDISGIGKISFGYLDEVLLGTQASSLGRRCGR